VLSWLNTMLSSYTAFFNTSTTAEFSLIGCMDLIGVIMSSHYRAQDFRAFLLADVTVHGLVVSIAKTVVDTVLKLLEVKREVYLKFSLLTHDSEAQYELLMQHLDSDDAGAAAVSDNGGEDMRKQLHLVRIRLVSILVVMWHLLYSHHTQPKDDVNIPAPPERTLTSHVAAKTGRGLAKIGDKVGLLAQRSLRSLTTGTPERPSVIGTGIRLAHSSTKKIIRQFSRQSQSQGEADVSPMRKLSVSMSAISDLTAAKAGAVTHKVLLPPKLRGTLKEATTPKGRHLIAKDKENHEMTPGKLYARGIVYNFTGGGDSADQIVDAMAVHAESVEIDDLDSMLSSSAREFIDMVKVSAESHARLEQRTNWLFKAMSDGSAFADASDPSSAGLLANRKRDLRKRSSTITKRTDALVSRTSIAIALDRQPSASADKKAQGARADGPRKSIVGQSVAADGRFKLIRSAVVGSSNRNKNHRAVDLDVRRIYGLTHLFSQLLLLVADPAIHRDTGNNFTHRSLDLIEQVCRCIRARARVCVCVCLCVPV
jgi:hypothetical protein